MHTKHMFAEGRLMAFRGNEKNVYNQESSDFRQQAPGSSTRSKLDPRAWEIQADERDKDITQRILREPKARKEKTRQRMQQEEFKALTNEEMASVDQLLATSANETTRAIHAITANTGSRLVRLETQQSLLETAARVQLKKLNRLLEIEASAADILDALATPEKRAAMEKKFQTQLVDLGRRREELQTKIDEQRKPLMMIEATKEELENTVISMLKENLDRGNARGWDLALQFRELLYQHIVADHIEEKETLLEQNLKVSFPSHPRLARCMELLKGLRARKAQTKRGFRFWKTYEKEVASDQQLLTWLKSEQVQRAQMNPPKLEDRLKVLGNMRPCERVVIMINGRPQNCIVQMQKTDGRAPMTRLFSQTLGVMVINAGNQTLHYVENQQDPEGIADTEKAEHFISLEAPTVSERTGAMRAGFEQETIYFSAA